MSRRGRKPRAKEVVMGDSKEDKAVPMIETPEFKAAVAAAVAAASPAIAKAVTAEVQTELLAKVKTSPVAGLTDQDGFAERLALAIAEISDQGTSRKRVAPEILAARARAHARCVDLIIAARGSGSKPEYRLISKVYLNEQLIEPFMPGPNKQPISTEIIWSGLPNDAMRPLNDVAKEIYREYRASVGSTGPLQGTDNRAISMTPGGLVIKGLGAAQRREVAAPLPFEDDLDIKGQNDPTAPFIHVLGTIAPAARQNATNQPQALS